MRTFLEISISATPAQREILIPTMAELGCNGFQESETALLCYIDKTRWDEKRFESLRRARTISPELTVKLREFVEENWNEQWEQSLEPVKAGAHVVIKPSWTSYATKPGDIVVTIDPKMSFGTGYHETTRLTMSLLERYLSPGDFMLDVGTGTGVLAIAAVKLGARAAVGIDIDEWSIENARENVLLNGVSGNVTISDSPLDQLNQPPFDVIAANLTLNTIVELLPQFAQRLRPDGLLILSGLLQSDAPKMTEELDTNRFHLLEQAIEHEWAALAARKR